MIDLPNQIIEIIRSECDFPTRYPPIPQLTADSDLDPRWFGPVDRCCVLIETEDRFGIEIPSADAEAWASIADVVASVRALIGEPA